MENLHSRISAAACDDPRRLRDLLLRSQELSSAHALPSVIAGLAGAEGELLWPELVNYIESALRVEDTIFRLTRERVVLFLADVSKDAAREIVERLLHSFTEHFPSAQPLEVARRFFEVGPGRSDLRLKDILPAIFPTADSNAA